MALLNLLDGKDLATISIWLRNHSPPHQLHFLNNRGLIELSDPSTFVQLLTFGIVIERAGLVGVRFQFEHLNQTNRIIFVTWDMPHAHDNIFSPLSAETKSRLAWMFSVPAAND